MWQNTTPAPATVVTAVDEDERETLHRLTLARSKKDEVRALFDEVDRTEMGDHLALQAAVVVEVLDGYSHHSTGVGTK
jgi:hypothetical protein